MSVSFFVIASAKKTKPCKNELDTTSSSSGSVISSKYPRSSKYDDYDIIICEDEPAYSIPYLNIYIGGGFSVEVKEFRKQFYTCITRHVTEDSKNRINIPVSQANNFGLAFNEILKHLKKYGH